MFHRKTQDMEGGISINNTHVIKKESVLLPTRHQSHPPPHASCSPLPSEAPPPVSMAWLTPACHTSQLSLCKRLLGLWLSPHPSSTWPLCFLPAVRSSAVPVPRESLATLSGQCRQKSCAAPQCCWPLHI